MHKNIAVIFVALLFVVMSVGGCTFPSYKNSALSTPTALIIPTLTPIPSLVLNTPMVALPTTTAAALMPAITMLPVTSAAQISTADFCADPQSQSLINSFKTALQTSNGTLLASLVSPIHGMDARLYRDGRIVNYDQQHAQFLFASNYVVDWGAAPASGLETKGSFHAVILPALLKVFNQDYVLDCNQVEIGGSTYKAAWPYAGISFYSVYFSGSPSSNFLDWHTWLIGMEYVGGKPYLYAIMQFFWEP